MELMSKFNVILENGKSFLDKAYASKEFIKDFYIGLYFDTPEGKYKCVNIEFL